ncbi:hypothetical protein F2Q70_00024601 [Brassica cretica]|uniref:RNase H type-1 domain-containing protein n=1 Tax=Brassica cretica TaxID=69181 RepID=A0A8S9IDP6_BRACR|nr:hypothetical protein F2Q68_00023920 [Brassica cretica]KAF2602826.1 hypothetical protein F2Q70_00024601 [Brassica cretica]
MPLNTFDLEWKRLLLTVVLPPVGLGNGSLAPWIIWAIWTTRNQKLFQNRNFSAPETVTKAICDAKEWLAAQLPVQATDHHLNPQQNVLTAEVICKSDAAWKKELQAAGLAWSFYRPQKERISSHNQPAAYVTSSLMAEGLPLRAAMEQAISLQMKRVDFESDSLQLVTAIADGSSFSDLHGILSDIYLLSISFDSVSFRFSRRESLCFEDSVAKKTLLDFALTQTIEPVLV